MGSHWKKKELPRDPAKKTEAAMRWITFLIAVSGFGLSLYNVWQARIAATMEKRAWVVESTADLEVEPGKGALAGKVTFRNVGQLPAINGQICTAAMIGPVITSAQNLKDCQNVPGVLLSNIVWGQDRDQYTTFKFPSEPTAKEVEDLLAKKSTLFVWGVLTYDDPAASGRRTEFCLRWRAGREFDFCDGRNGVY